MKSQIILSTFLALTLLAACSSDKRAQETSEVHESRQAAAKVEDSFSVPAPTTAGAPAEVEKKSGSFSKSSGSTITIKRSALKDAFLMTPHMIFATNEPILDALQGKVVSFEESGDDIALVELNRYAVYEGLPSDRVITTFKIVNKSDSEITFKWDLQFSTLSLKDGMGVSDFPESLAEQLNPVSDSLSVTNSVIKGIQIKNEQLEIDQLVKLRIMGEGTAKDASVRLNVRIQPYKVNPRFVVKKSTEQKGIGYFETATTRKGDGQIEVLASRWDMSPELPPVTYSISKDVPPYMVEAVKEGVLYWNRVAGRELFRVETGAEPSEIPQYRRATIHWVNFLKGTFARANIQADPLSGEILSASVYATNFWDVGGQEVMRRSMTEPKIGVSGFATANVCNFHKDHNPLDNFAVDNPGMALKGAEDFVRMMIAHEVGHTLGLRHNFAGTIGSVFPNYKERDKAWKEYLKVENHPGAEVTTSVMDYTSRGDDFLSGRFLKNQVLSYDRAAIDWGYGKGDLAEKDVPYFCTDGERIKGEILGCEIGDVGKNPIDGYVGTIKETQLTMGDRILYYFLKSKFPKDIRNKKTLKEAALAFKPKTYANLASDNFKGALKFLRGKPTAMEADRYQGGRNWMNEEEYQKAAFQLVGQRFDEVGGLPGLLNASLQRKEQVFPRGGWILEQVQARLKDPTFSMGKTPEAVDYSLTERDMRELTYYAELAAKKVEDVYLTDVLAALASNEKPYAEELIKDEWQGEVGDIARALLLDGDGEITFEVDGQPARLSKPKFKKEHRLLGLKLLSKTVFPKEKWAEATRKLIDSTFEARLGIATDRDGVGNPEPKDRMKISDDAMIVLLVKNSSGRIVPKKGLPREAMEWLEEEMELYEAFQIMRMQERY